MKNLFKKFHFGFFPLLIFAFLATHTNAQTKAPEWEWAVKVGTNLFQRGSVISVDQAGNSYLTGWFQGKAKFGDTILTSSGIGEDIFIAKLDRFGQIEWITKAGGGWYDYGYSIKVDPTGNIYVTGAFWYNANFGDTKLSSSGEGDIFIAKLNNKGKWQWAIKAGGIGKDFGNSISLDHFGNIYISGNFSDTASFGNKTLIADGQGLQKSDIFIAKLSNDGDWQWIVKAGGPDYIENNGGVALDSNGNIFLTGSFKDSIVFGSIVIRSSGLEDLFIAKLNNNGQWQWAVNPEGSSNEYSRGIKIDASGNIYITGVFFDKLKFGNTILSSSGDQDIFVAKLDTGSQWKWAVKAGGPEEDDATGISIDSSGNLFITGNFNNTLNLGGIDLTSLGLLDIFIAKLTSDGQWDWAVRAGGKSVDLSQSIAADASGYAFITGYYYDTARFGNTDLSSWGGKGEIFVAKLGNKAVTNIQDMELEKFNINIYPNPSTNILTIETSRPTDTPIIITDITGRQVMQVKSTNESKLNLDISSLAKGLYFIQLNKESYKFIKN